MKDPVRRSDAIEAYVLEELARGRTLRAICREPGMPSDMAVRKWTFADPDGFGSQYARARDSGLDAVAEEVIEISDDGTRDRTVDEEGHETVDHDHISRAKLRVDTRKWYLSKIAPKRYGDRTEHAVDVTHRYVVVGETEALTDETWIEGTVER